MNVDLIPALAAAGGGSAMLAGIWTHERRRDEAMRASRVRLSMRFPANLDPIRAYAALDGLSGLPYTNELIAEIEATEGTIRHFLWIPETVRASATSTLTGVVGSIRLSQAPPPPDSGATLTLRLFVPTPSVLAGGGAIEASGALLAGLSGLRAGEQVVVRWALRPGAPRRGQGRDPESQSERDAARAWHRKETAPGFSVAGLVLVRASTTAHARELAGHIESVVRSRRGLVGQVRLTAERGNRRLSALPRTTRSSGWLTTAELLPLLGWPLGSDLTPGVEVGAARELPVPRGVPREGRQLFIGRDALGERPVALSAEAITHHLAVVGPSGVGKSALLARSILSDIDNGFAGAVIDPKADLVEAVLNRVKPEHAERIVVLDPSARSTPGVSVMAGGDSDLRADVLTGALRSAFPTEAWGVRTDYYLRLGIRTLSELPKATLADIGRLYFDERFRQAAVVRLRDPFLISAWQSYAALSPGSQAEHLQAPLARISALLSRPKLRAVLANPDPKLDVARLFRERKWLLVSLAPGVIGEAGAQLVGAVLMYVIWSAIEGRVALPHGQRHPLALYVDELATVTNGLPGSFELIAERARGLGAGLTVAIQTLSRIPEPTRSALIGNVASFITFRAGAEEAPRIARQLPGLTEADVVALARFEVAARIGTGIGSAVTVVTGRTQALPAETGIAASIRARSAERYGGDREPAPVPVAPEQGREPGGERPPGRTGRAA
jgi:hypothetical protein